jgi:hypothetical protein
LIILPTHIPRQVKWSSLQPCEQGPRQASAAMCKVNLFFIGIAHHCTARGARRSLSPLLFTGLPLTAALESCTPLRSIVIHCTSSRYIRSPTALARYVWVMNPPHIHSRITTNSTRSQRNAHSTTFRSIHFVFHSVDYSPPAALVVLACACRPGCGLSCFLHPDLLANARPIAFNNPSREAKNHACPCSVRPLR